MKKYNSRPVRKNASQFEEHFLFMEEYVVYILQSLKDGSYYIGHTEDMAIRLKQHNDGLSKYTSSKIPWNLVYTEKFSARQEAMKREYFLKKQRNRHFYQRLIDEKNK